MPTEKKKYIALRFNLPEESVLSRGIEGALVGIRLTNDGKVIVPVHVPGAVINNPAPCGEWEHVD